MYICYLAPYVAALRAQRGRAHIIRSLCMGSRNTSCACPLLTPAQEGGESSGQPNRARAAGGRETGETERSRPVQQTDGHCLYPGRRPSLAPSPSCIIRIIACHCCC